MNLNLYSTNDYENKPRLQSPGKQTQSNPISKGTLTQSRQAGFRFKILTSPQVYNRGIEIALLLEMD